jgi:WD40-like Beta Propeller Repeat
MKRALALAAMLLSGCASRSLPIPAAWKEPIPRTPRIEAVAIGGNGKLLYYSSRDGAQCTLHFGPLGGAPVQAIPLGFCPVRILPLSDGTTLIRQRGGASVLLDGEGNAIAGEGIPLIRSGGDRALLAAASRGTRLERAVIGGRLEILTAGSRRPLDTGCLSDARFRPVAGTIAGVTCGSEAKLLASDGAGRLKALTPSFPAIDSFAFSPDGDEIVFSARRDQGFDIGLVSSDGSEIHWVPPVRGDETNVSYAPRGHKIAYFLRAADAALVRTVHVPTSTQLTADFPFSTVRDLAWLPEGDKYVVAVSSVDSGDRVELLRYDGSERTTLVAPAARLAQEIETLGSGRSGEAMTVIRPPDLRYNERVPLVVWTGEESPYVWDDDRARLHTTVRVASAMTPRDAGTLDDAFWKALRGLPWIDPDKIYVVSPGPLPAKLAKAIGTSGPEAWGPATFIAPAAPGTNLTPDRYLQRIVGTSRAILLRPGQAGSVKSAAAALIAAQLKGPAPQNDHR